MAVSRALAERWIGRSYRLLRAKVADRMALVRAPLPFGTAYQVAASFAAPWQAVIPVMAIFDPPASAKQPELETEPAAQVFGN